jgi:hypothetical protein
METFFKLKYQNIFKFKKKDTMSKITKRTITWKKLLFVLRYFIYYLLS